MNYLQIQLFAAVIKRASMNGWELERLLDMIDQNLEENEVRLREEILRFITKHEDDVVDQLHKHKSVTVPTSFGEFVLMLGDLRNKILNPIAA
jgi:hypothetical protein